MPYKLCPKCEAPNGVRSKECPCGQAFAVKIKKPSKCKTAEVDWSELQKGDMIKSVGSHGPYREYPDGKMYMGEYGIIKVDKVEKTGIHGFNKDGSHVFLYMGPQYTGNTGTIMASHKVRKVS